MIRRTYPVRTSSPRHGELCVSPLVSLGTCPGPHRQPKLVGPLIHLVDIESIHVGSIHVVPEVQTAVLSIIDQGTLDAGFVTATMVGGLNIHIPSLGLNKRHFLGKTLRIVIKELPSTKDGNTTPSIEAVTTSS